MKQNSWKSVSTNIDLSKADDKTLLQEIKEGNQLAHNEIYVRYFKFLKTEAYYLLKDIDHAENAVQDVFLIILEKQPKIKCDSQLKYFLFNTIRKQCNSSKKK